MFCNKGIYLYEYMDSWDRLSETALPAKYKFYSKLNDDHITDEEYAHAQNVWERFECKNLGDYHDLYVKTDVALLADVFENFRTLCMEKYVLDSAHYFTSPGLSWDALLKMSGVELELLTDMEMHLFIERGMSKPLPIRDFKWRQFLPTEEDILNKKENAKRGWIFEVDLEYPAEMQRLSPGAGQKAREKRMDVGLPKKIDERPGS